MAKKKADSPVSFADLIRESMKLQVRDFLDRFEIDHPDEHLYARR
jgi:hypothetical protein